MRDMKSTGYSQSFLSASGISETCADESSLRTSASVAGMTAGGTGCCSHVCIEVRVGEDTDAGEWYEVRRRTRALVSERAREPTGRVNAEGTDGRVVGESDRGVIHLPLSTPRGGTRVPPAGRRSLSGSVPGPPIQRSTGVLGTAFDALLTTLVHGDDESSLESSEGVRAAEAAAGQPD